MWTRTNKLTRNLRLLAALGALANLVWPLQAMRSVTLVWEPCADSCAAGYRVHCRKLASTNVVSLDAGNTNCVTVTNLAETETYTFNVTAYSSDGLESEPSNSVEYTVPLGPLASVATRDSLGRPVMKFKLDAIESRRVALQSSTDFVQWTTLLISEPGQPLACQVTNAVSDRKRFYRAICLF
jgi:hypothetical protein